MKAFVLMLILGILFFLIASSGLAQVDLTPGVQDTNVASFVPQEAPQVITIQNTAGAAVIDTSPQIPVTGASVCTNPYAVQPGDILSGIAAACGLTIADIRAANPEITNANFIYPGQQIRIPGAPAAQLPVPVTGDDLPAQTLQFAVPTPTAINSALAGYPLIRSGTPLQVQAIDYPANTVVNIAIGPVDGLQNVVATGITDANGQLISTIIAPAANGDASPWVVVVTTTGAQAVSASSDPFLLTTAAP